jgi:hypothetical protein
LRIPAVKAFGTAGSWPSSPAHGRASVDTFLDSLAPPRADTLIEEFAPRVAADVVAALDAGDTEGAFSHRRRGPRCARTAEWLREAVALFERLDPMIHSSGHRRRFATALF